MGRKRIEWVSGLYKEILEEFYVLPTASVKLSSEVLRQAAIYLIQTAPDDSLYCSTCNFDGILIQDFMAAHNLVRRKQTGKLDFSPQKQLLV